MLMTGASWVGDSAIRDLEGFLTLIGWSIVCARVQI